jgi:ribonucleoside-diphosphate reductase alpha chain
MQMNQQTLAAVTFSHLPLQPASLDIWSEKYCLRDVNSDPIDADVEATLVRNAKALARSEKPDVREQKEKEFLEALRTGAVPAGRIMSNAGAEDHKNAVSLINCTVSDTIPDSMDGILKKNWESGLTLKAGCGIGYEFSTIRPDGAYVAGAGAATSGPLPFMDIFDRTCGTVKSAGARRGAQMGTFDITHPDTPSFITSKREAGRFRNFNLSLLITDEFIEAVKANAIWEFKWDGKPFYRKNKDTGEKIKAEMPAIDLWNMIMLSNFNFAEPGFLLIDKINHFNNLWFCEHLRATNPCGEQPLPPYGSCLLGSINLTMFVINPFTPQASFDFERFYRICRTFARMLDNVVEQNGLPLPEQRQEIEYKRRHGMGYLGLGSTMAMLGMRYGSEEAIELTNVISQKMAFANFEESAMLSKEKGEAPVLAAVYQRKDIEGYLKYNTNFVKTFTADSTHFTGRQLFLISHYFDTWREDQEGRRILALLEEHGSRYSHATSIAPTGTIAFSFGNNASNGIEPSFSHFYTRNVIRPGRATKESVPVYSYEYLLYRAVVDPDATPNVISKEQHDAVIGDRDFMTQEEENQVVADYCLEHHVLPPQFAATSELTPKEHIDIQAASQKWIDSSISKTINVATDISFDDFQDIYMYAYSKGLKGCTTYRYNPDGGLGQVLAHNSDLKATTYQFKLADGTVVEATGDQQIQYDGQLHSASNLFDAIREGTYGKY